MYAMLKAGLEQMRLARGLQEEYMHVVLYRGLHEITANKHS